MQVLKSHTGLGPILVALVVLALAPVAVSAQEAEGDVASLIERGKASYTAHCAACHGTDGAGNGMVAEYLTVKPTDLTALSSAGAEFPFDGVYDIVDGRAVPGHGTREMPVWGPAFKGMDEGADKKVVKEKIVELVYYLKSIQGKAAAQ